MACRGYWPCERPNVKTGRRQAPHSNGAVLSNCPVSMLAHIPQGTLLGKDSICGDRESPFLGLAAPHRTAPASPSPSILSQEEGVAGHGHDCCRKQQVGFGIYLVLPAVMDGKWSVLC